MTTKTQLQQKIAELQAQVDAMPDNKPVVKNDVCFDKGEFAVRSKQGKRAYGRAFQTILHLHMLSDWRGGRPWGILDGYDELNPTCAPTLADRFLGNFATRQSAQAAIDTVGKANIEYAVKVLTGGGYE